jgi:opacity protein-like surface antigen
LILLASLLYPATASAEWLISPFVALKFGGSICPCTLVNTDLVDPEDATGLRKWALGGAFGFLTDGVFGLETEFAYVPGYFNRADAPNQVVGSSVITWTGNVLVALPAAVSRDGLRPYVTAGAGLVRFRRENIGGVFSASSRQPTLVFGGGALGRLTDRTSLRFDLRRFIGNDDQELGYGISFWRATVGVTIRY